MIDTALDIDAMSKKEMRDLLRKIFEDEPAPTTVLRYDKPRRSDEHPTMKPVPMIGDLILNRAGRASWSSTSLADPGRP